MAASQSLTERLPPDKSSFAAMVRGTQDSTFIDTKEASLHKGEPALIYSAPEINDLSSSLRFALIGKFTTDRPSMEFLRQGFKTIGFKGDFRLGLMDQRHILIRFDLEEDYHRCWLHNSWKFRTYSMKVLKWTSDFTTKEEPPVVPVWVSLEQLPLFLFARAPLFSIGRILGNPLKIDAATHTLSRPSVARLCVEVDLRNQLPSRIWIGLPNGGFWQSIKYDQLPQYCFDCFSFSHQREDCGHKIDVAAKGKKVVAVPEKATTMKQQVISSPLIDPATAATPTAVVMEEALAQISQDTQAIDVANAAVHATVTASPVTEATTTPTTTQVIEEKSATEGVNDLLPIPAPVDQQMAVLATTAPTTVEVTTVTLSDPENQAKITQEKFVPLPTHSPENRENLGPQLEIILPIWPQQKNYQNSDEEEEEDEDDEEDFLDKQFVRDDSYLEDRKSRRKSRDQFSVQFRRGRGRPPGSRRTYSEVIRTINTRAKTVD